MAIDHLPMPDTFLSRFDELRFEEYDWLALMAAERVGDGAALRFHLRTDGRQNPISEMWVVRCDRWLDWLLTSRPRAGKAGVELQARHPLLWDYAQPQTSLSFRGQPDSAAELARRLGQVHAKTFAPFTVPGHINGAFDLVTLLSGGHGLLATGPVPLMRRYAEVCAEHGVAATLLREREAPHPEFSNVLGTSKLRALTFGQSYVIGAGWSAERVDDG
jgi:hypothetical protein